MDNYFNRLINLQFLGFPFCAVVTKFCEKSKIVSSDFSMITKIVVPSFLSSVPIELICCLESDFLDSISVFKSIAIIFNNFKNNKSPTNYVI